MLNCAVQVQYHWHQHKLSIFSANVLKSAILATEEQHIYLMEDR